MKVVEKNSDVFLSDVRFYPRYIHTYLDYVGINSEICMLIKYNEMDRLMIDLLAMFGDLKHTSVIKHWK